MAAFLFYLFYPVAADSNVFQPDPSSEWFFLRLSTDTGTRTDHKLIFSTGFLRSNPNIHKMINDSYKLTTIAVRCKA